MLSFVFGFATVFGNNNSTAQDMGADEEGSVASNESSPSDVGSVPSNEPSPSGIGSTPSSEPNLANAKAPSLAGNVDSSHQGVTDGATELVPAYQVECTAAGVCKVDKDTFKGWRTFHGFCAACHAQDAVGSTFAPSLLDRTKGMNKARFMEVLANGVIGQSGVMPGWKENPNVMPKADQLWGYIRARADGVLGVGRPGKL